MVFDTFFTACATSKKLVRGIHLSATFGGWVKRSYREQVLLKGAVSRNSVKLGNYKMPVKLRET